MKMIGWLIPPPTKPTKTREEFAAERKRKVEQLRREGLLRSEALVQAMLKVPREEFIPAGYKDYAYYGSAHLEEIPLPIPGENATISCPHAYPLFYEPLEIREGDKFLEVGMGSGYGAALAREAVGQEGKVVTVEMDEVTYNFGKGNLERLFYSDVRTVLADGSLSFKEDSPYDKISITAVCRQFPHHLIDQLKVGGKMIGPIGSLQLQKLALLHKASSTGLRTKYLENVLFVPLKGKYSPVY
jgi:protein-L-isoaspartate(D-aspartate) O-methyltransferase